VLIPDPVQATAVLAWLLAALNVDDEGAAITPAPFVLGATCYLGERDHAKAARFARIATVALVGRGLCRRYVATDVGGPAQALTEQRWEHQEWTTSITVASRLDPEAPLLSDAASVHLRRALGARDGVAAAGLRAAGVSWLRGTDVQDTSRIAGGTTWETRATATLVWLCGWRASTPTDWVDRVLGTGQVGDVGPLPFDTDLGA
jgi:hypothetical protein